MHLQAINLPYDEFTDDEFITQWIQNDAFVIDEFTAMNLLEP